MSWLGAIPLVFDHDDVGPDETAERIAALGAELTTLAEAHGFHVIPAPKTSDEALAALNACEAGAAAARAAYVGLTGDEARSN